MEYITKVMDPIEEFKEMITEKTAPLVKTEEVLKPVKSFKRLTGETSIHLEYVKIGTHTLSINYLIGYNHEYCYEVLVKNSTDKIGCQYDDNVNQFDSIEKVGEEIDRLRRCII